MGYSSADVRRFLTTAFSDEEIETFCFDYFPEAHSDFSAGMPKGDKIQRLIAYCQQHACVSQLFATLQAQRPDQYQRYFGALPPPADFEPGSVMPAGTLGAGLSPQSSAVLIDRLIANQRRSARHYLLSAGVLVVLGIAVSICGLYLPGNLVPPDFRPFIGVGGIFVASLSTLQFKEVFNRQEKAGVLETLKGGLSLVAQGSAQTSADTQQRISGLLWQVLEKAAVG